MHMSSTALPTCLYRNPASAYSTGLPLGVQAARDYPADASVWDLLFHWGSVRLCLENELRGGRFHFCPFRVISKANGERLQLWCDALGTTGLAARFRNRHRDLRGLRPHDTRYRVHRRSVGDQGEPRAPGGQSAPSATPTSASNFAIIDLVDAHRVTVESENFDFMRESIYGGELPEAD